MNHDFCNVLASGTLIDNVVAVGGKEDVFGISGTVAIEKYYTGKDGIPKKNTNFMNFIYWCKPNMKEELNIKKGDRIFLEGEIILKSWEQEGKKRYKHELKLKSLKKA
jgi:single-stranded DNA-binding protein